MSFPELDETKTYFNVRKFFNKKKFDYYLQLSGKNRFDLKSPQFDSAGTNKINFNSKENEMIEMIYAQKIVYCVGIAINQCTNSPRRPYKKILIENFINQYTVTEVASIIGYSRTQTYKLKKQACLEFARRFWSVQYQINVSDVTNLLAFKNHSTDVPIKAQS